MKQGTTSERNKARRASIIAQILFTLLLTNYIVVIYLNSTVQRGVIYDSQLFVQAVQIGEQAQQYVQDGQQASAS